MKSSRKFLAIIIPLLVIIPMLVGYSLWLVGEKQDEIPTYTYKDLLEKNVKLSATYKAAEFDITDDNETIENELNATFDIPWNEFNVSYYSSKIVSNNGENIEYGYNQKLDSKPINADIYFINIKSALTSVDNEKTDENPLDGAWIEFTINKATPKLKENFNLTIGYKNTATNNPITLTTYIKDISVTDPDNTNYGVYHDESASKNKVEGTFLVKDITATTTPSNVGINNYTYTFTPSDTTNFTTAEFDVGINVFATVKFELGSNYAGSFSYGPVYCDVTANNSNGALLEKPSTDPSPEIHYAFNCWTKVKDNAEGDNVWKFESDFVTSDITLYAYFKPIDYKIIYNLDGGTNNSNNPTTYNVENEVILDEPTRVKYKFLGWFDENGDNVASLDISSCQKTDVHSHDVTLLAKWEHVKTITKPTVKSNLTFNDEIQNFVLSFDNNEIFIINENQYKAEDLVNITGEDHGYEVKTYYLYVELNPIAIEYGIKWSDDNTTNKIEFKINIEAFELNSSNTSITKDNEEYTYTGKELIPKLSKVSTKLNTKTIDLIEKDDFIITYGNNINAGTGIICIKGQKNYKGSLTITFTINKAKPIITNKPIYKSIYEGELDNGSKPTISTEGSANTDGIFDFISFKNIDVIDGVNYYYSKDGYSSSDGYPAEINYRFTPSDTSNYEIINDTTSLLIIPVAFSDSRYYGSIEHAIKSISSGVINVIADTNEKRRVRTDCTINSEQTLQFLYSTSTNIIDLSTDYYPYEIDSWGATLALDSTTCRKNLITVDDNIKIVNNGKIFIGGKISSGNGGCSYNSQTCSDYAEIRLSNNAIIENNNGSYLVVYGAIKNKTNHEGNVTINNGATLQIPFIVIEHRGGTIFTQIKLNMKGSAFNRFFFQNICSKTIIKYGGIFKAFVSLYANNDSNSTTIKMVGNDNNYLINLKNNSYLISEYDNETRINNINFYGNFDLNSLTMDIVGNTLSTSDILFPISWYYHITLNKLDNSSSDAIVNLNQNIKILPGAIVKISNNVNVKVNQLIVYDLFDDVAVGSGDLYPKDKGNGRLIVNGVLEITSRGQIGGLIETTEDNAELIIAANASTSITSYEIKEKGLVLAKWNEYTRSCGIYLYTSSGISTTPSIASTTTYYSYKKGWVPNSNISISYNSNGGSSVETKSNLTITKYGYTLTENDVPDDISRDHYEFKGWYLDNNFEVQINVGDCIYTNITLYAKWKPINYTIEYYNKYYNNSTTEKITNSNNMSSFNINTIKTALLDPINGNYVFAGWYTDQTLTNEITSLEGNTLINYLDENNKVLLYALWYPEGTKSYTITLINPNDAPEKSDIDKIVKIVDDNYNWDEVNLPTLGGEYNNNPLENIYFAGWYKKAEMVSNINFGLFETTDNINYTLELNATWKNKSKVTFKNNFDNLSNNIEQNYLYFNPESTYSVDDINKILTDILELDLNNVISTNGITIQDTLTTEGYKYLDFQLEFGSINDYLQFNNDETLVLNYTKMYRIKITNNGSSKLKVKILTNGATSIEKEDINKNNSYIYELWLKPDEKYTIQYAFKNKLLGVAYEDYKDYENGVSIVIKDKNEIIIS